MGSDDDPHNQAGDLAQRPPHCPRVGRVHEIVRAYLANRAEVQALSEKTGPDRLDVVSEPAEVPLRISRCHLAVTAGNNWSLEMACVGVQQLIVVQSEVHWPTAQQLEEAGAAACL